jgi:hypothetical protein
MDARTNNNNNNRLVKCLARVEEGGGSMHNQTLGIMSKTVSLSGNSVDPRVCRANGRHLKDGWGLLVLG